MHEILVPGGTEPVFVGEIEFPERGVEVGEGGGGVEEADGGAGDEGEEAGGGVVEVAV